MKEAWVDGVAAEITKKSLKTSVEQCEAVVRFQILLLQGTLSNPLRDTIKLYSP